MMHKLIIEQIKVIGKMPDEAHQEIARDVRALVKAHNEAVCNGDRLEIEGTYNNFIGFVKGVLYAHVVVKWRLDDGKLLN